MATLKYDPYELLYQEDISKEQLGDQAAKSLVLFDKAKQLHEKRPDSKDFLENAEKAAKIAYEVIKKDIVRIKQGEKETQAGIEKAEVKKEQSKKVVEKATKDLDYFKECREKLKAERKRKIESGEIQPPKKRTLTTKLRADLLHFAVLIPEKLRNDPKIIEKTEKAILRFLSELKSIWGLDKIKTITDELREKFRKLEEAAIKPKDFRQN